MSEKDAKVLRIPTTLHGCSGCHSASWKPHQERVFTISAKAVIVKQKPPAALEYFQHHHPTIDRLLCSLEPFHADVRIAALCHCATQSRCRAKIARMARSDGQACDIRVSRPEGLHRKNGRFLQINDVQLAVGHNGDRSFFNGNLTVISDFSIRQNPHVANCS
jgi:hypothetical protein